MIQLIHTKIENGRVVELPEVVRVEPIRITATNRTLQNKNGAQTIANFKILLNPDTDISVSTKILYEGKKYEILSIYKPTSAEGEVNHLQVIV